jgi:alginate O-acetyltransferase complex protein AlgJ
MKETSRARTGTPSSPAFLRRLPAVILVLVLAAGLALALSSPGTFAFEPPPGGRGTLLRGERAAAWQKRFEEGLRGRSLALGMWTAVRYVLFAEGEPGVLVGRDGWLFSSEELAAVDRSGKLLAAAVDRIAVVRDALDARGIALVVALVPTKAMVCAAHLGSRNRLDPALRGRYALILAGLERAGVTASDLFSVLGKASRHTEVFLRTDTHWSPQGAEAAAGALAGPVRAELDRRGVPRSSWITVRGEPRERRGDLLAFLPFGPLAAVLGPRPDMVATVLTEPAAAPDDSGAGLFGELRIPVALVGTSYSAAGAWNFDGALRQALACDVLKVAEEGRGPFAPMEMYLASPALEDPRPDVVVWEIPERYLCTPTPLGIARVPGAAGAD